MRPDRSVLVSAGVVGVVLIGGISVTATAFAGRVDKGSAVSKDHAGHGKGKKPSPSHSGPVVITEETPAPEDIPDVVSTQFPGDLGDIGEYWTPDRMQDAQPATPVPVPQVSISIIRPAD